LISEEVVSSWKEMREVVVQFWLSFSYATLQSWYLFPESVALRGRERVRTGLGEAAEPNPFLPYVLRMHPSYLSIPDSLFEVKVQST